MFMQFREQGFEILVNKYFLKGNLHINLMTLKFIQSLKWLEAKCSTKLHSQIRLPALSTNIQARMGVTYSNKHLLIVDLQPSFFQKESPLQSLSLTTDSCYIPCLCLLEGQPSMKRMKTMSSSNTQTTWTSSTGWRAPGSSRPTCHSKCCLGTIL